MKNLGQMMKQAQEMQTRMQQMQDALAEVEVTGQSGAGMVNVTLNGKGEMKRLKLDQVGGRSRGCRSDRRPDHGRLQRRQAEGRAACRRRNPEADGRNEASAGPQAAVLSMPVPRPPLYRELRAAGRPSSARSRQFRNRPPDSASVQTAGAWPPFGPARGAAPDQTAGNPADAAGRRACRGGGRDQDRARSAATLTPATPAPSAPIPGATRR